MRYRRDGDPGAALAYLAVGAAPAYPILILHSWWGLTSSFTDYADRLAAVGCVAGCVDLYAGAIAETPEEAKQLRSQPRRRPMYRTMLAAMTQLLGHPAVAYPRVGIVGFSMGGHWAVWLAQRADVPAAGAVVYYATRAATKGDPVPVLAHFADQDPFVTAGGRRTMQRSLAKLGWPYQGRDYPGTGHWFAESAEAAYAPAAAQTALAHDMAFWRGCSWG